MNLAAQRWPEISWFNDCRLNYDETFNDSRFIYDEKEERSFPNSGLCEVIIRPAFLGIVADSISKLGLDLSIKFGFDLSIEEMSIWLPWLASLPLLI